MAWILFRKQAGLAESCDDRDSRLQEDDADSDQVVDGQREREYNKGSCAEEVDQRIACHRDQTSFRWTQLPIGDSKFSFEPLPEKLKQILDNKGLVNYMKTI